MERWIKISNEITTHWIFQNAEYFKWWFELLMMAAWRDHKVMHDTHLFILKRGQAIASVLFLAQRWRRSKPTIIRFLKLLEKDCMITRSTLYRQTSIITICNYDRYQLQVDPIVDPIVDTNRRKGIERDRKYIVANNARTCEETSQNDEIGLLQEMKLDATWLELMCMRFHLSRSDVISCIDDFKLDCECRKAKHENLADIQRHFCNWLIIKLKNQKQHENRIDDQGQSKRLADAAQLVQRLLREDDKKNA